MMIKNKEQMISTTTSLGHSSLETFLERDTYHHHEEDHKSSEYATTTDHEEDEEEASTTTATTKKTTTTPAASSSGGATSHHDHHHHQQTHPSPSKRKVHFRVTQFSYVEPDVIVPPLPISDLFYTKRELERINRENRAIITCLEYGGTQGTSLWETTTKNDDLLCSLLDDPPHGYDDDGEYCHQHIHDKQQGTMDVTEVHQQRRMQQQQRMLQQQVESPVRGLEDKTTDGFKRRYWNQQPALRAVFREQAQQRQEGIKDPHTLAQLYALFSQDSQREARQRGKNDAAIAKSAMYLTTTIRDDKNKKNSNEEQQGGTTTAKIVVKDHRVDDDGDDHHQEMEQDSCCMAMTRTAIGRSTIILPPLASFSVPLDSHQQGEEKNHSTTKIISRIGSNKKNYHEYISTGQMTSSTAALGTSSVSLWETSPPTLLEPPDPLTSISSPPTSRNLLAANGCCVHQVCDHHDGLEDLLRIHVLPL